MPNGNILIVDDEPHISEMLKLRLEANGFLVTCADSGNAALKALELDGDIDIIMTDIMMPGMDGIELMRNIKNIYPDKEVILITGFASLETAIEAVRLGGYDYIKKPFEDIHSLLQTVKNAIDKSRLVTERRKIAEALRVSNENLKRVNLMLGENVNDLVMLHHIVESISGVLSIGDIIYRFLHSVRDALEFRRVALFLKNDDENILELKGSVVDSDKPLGTMAVSIEDTSKEIVRAMFAAEPTLMAGVMKDTPDKLLQNIKDKDTRSIVFFPMRVREESIGILIIESDKEILTRKISSLKLFVNHAALILANARMYQKLLKINEDLKDMDKIKNEFISTVSHELRTPLTTVKESISIVLEGIAGEINARQEKLLEISKKDVDRLGRLIEDLLDISRIDAGKVILERSRISVKTVIERACLSVKALAKDRSIELKSTCPGDLPFGFADDNRIIQVLVNLMANAIRFSKEKGTVTVSATTANEEFLEIDVKDDGMGIADENRGKLFHKFSQIGREYGGGSKGTGLGLAISKELVTLSGGKIWLKESSPEKGSTFSFTIPVYLSGIEDKVMFEDSVDAEIKMAKRVGGVFTIVLFKNKGKAVKADMITLKEAIRKELTSQNDVVAVYSESQVLALLKGAAKSAAGLWKENIIKIIGEDLNNKFESDVISYPDDGESRDGLLLTVTGD